MRIGGIDLWVDRQGDPSADAVLLVAGADAPGFRWTPALVDRLVAEQDTLVVPGSCFGLDRHFRFSSALAEPYLVEGIGRINRLVSDILNV